MNALRHVGPAAWCSLLATVFGALAATVLLVVAASHAGYTAIASGEAPAAASLQALRLDHYGVPWRLQDHGGSLAVPSADAVQARAVLGLTGPASPTQGGGVPSGGMARGAVAQHLNAMLDRVLGPGKAYVWATVTRNTNGSAATRLAYAPRGVVLSAGRSRRRFRTASGAYQAGMISTAWARGQVVTTTRFARGAVVQEHLALVVAPSLPGRTVSQLRRAVATAAGLQPGRGDTLTVSRLPLGRTTATTGATATALASPIVRVALADGRWALLALGIAGFLMAVRRSLTQADRA